MSCSIRKIIISAVVTIFVLFSSVIFADQANLSFNKIVFFGDSLTDDGNLYRFDDGFLPKSPPYSCGLNKGGCFSNGPTWSMLTANVFQGMGMTTENYAVGGATAVLHNPFKGFTPYFLDLEVNSYIANNFNYLQVNDIQNTLFVIWIGSNDYLLGNTNVKRATNQVVAAIKYQIEKLTFLGARNFVVINLPDISRSPSAMGRGQAVVANLHNLVVTHNKKLNAMLIKLQNNLKRIQPNLRIVPIDMFDSFNQLLNNPATFNAQYNTDITDTTTACWNGGYSIPNPTAAEISDQLNQSGIQTSNQKNALDANQLAAAIQYSPDLQEAYAVGQKYEQGFKVCLNPNNHVFWDQVHPTKQVHQIISTIITEDIMGAEQ